MSEIGESLSGNPIDSAGVVKQTVAMLFFGWGYNWYRKENQLRADDLLIRSKVSDYLRALDHAGKKWWPPGPQGTLCPEFSGRE